MNMHAVEFRRCLAELDVARTKALWSLVNPYLPPPENDEQILVTLHMARTRANSLSTKQRAYSYRWLTERGYPSGLPDALKPVAERLYPKVVGAVGISVNFTLNELKPAGRLIEKAMSDTVMDLYADGEERPETVRKAMMAAGVKERRKLFGRG
jgi:hypothetical protein